jgi:hypothetical protein
MLEGRVLEGRVFVGRVLVGKIPAGMRSDGRDGNPDVLGSGWSKPLVGRGSGGAIKGGMLE